MKPLIGITIGPAADVPAELHLRAAYPRAVERAGGIPVLIPPMASYKALLDRLDGLVFPGGLDVDPSEFGQDRHPKTDVNAALDALELAVARLAVRSELPTLGICRGQQLLNVALGGSLHQHIEGHELRKPAGQHALSVAPGSRLSEILHLDACDVNSRHHQSVDRLGAGLHAVAWAADGTIEALESDRHPWLLAVQFHPEDLVGAHAPSELLFEAFIQAATRRVMSGGSAIVG